MIKVKTFTIALEVFHVAKALADLDRQVNQFVEQEKVRQVMSVSDAATTDQKGATIGLIRVVAYEA